MNIKNILTLLLVMGFFYSTYSQSIPEKVATIIGSEHAMNNGKFITYDRCLSDDCTKDELLKPFIFRDPTTHDRKVIWLDYGEIKSAGESYSVIKLYVINIDKNSYTIVVPKDINGNNYTNSMGLIWTFGFGPLNKIYFLSSVKGVLSSFDYVTEEFKIIKEYNYTDTNDPALMYAFHIGMDGVIYTTVRGTGKIRLYSYNPYTNTHENYGEKLIDPDLEYGYYLATDATHVYISCGQEQWKLYSVLKVAPFTKTLIATRNNRIFLSTTNHGVTAQFVGDSPEKKNISPSSYSNLNTSLTYIDYLFPRNSYHYYSDSLYATENEYPKVYFDLLTSTVKYKLSNSNNFQSIFISSIILQKQLIENLVDVGTDIYSLGGQYKFIYKLNKTSNQSSLVGDFLAHSTKSVLFATNKIYIGSYSSGNISQFDINQPWNLNSFDFSIPLKKITDIGSNPKQLFYTNVGTLNSQNYNGTQVPFVLIKTSDSILVAAGNVDRSVDGITISSFANNSQVVFEPSYLRNYRIINAVLSNNGKTILFSTSTIDEASENSKIYEFNPSTNQFIDSVQYLLNDKKGGFIVPTDFNTIYIFKDSSNRTLAIEYDLNDRKIIWQHYYPTKLNDDSTFIKYKYGTDGYIWFKSGPTFSKFNPYTRKIKTAFTILPSSLLPYKTFEYIFSGNDMYIGGGTKFQKIANATQSLPLGINNFEKRQILLNDFFN